MPSPTATAIPLVPASQVVPNYSAKPYVLSLYQGYQKYPTALGVILWVNQCPGSPEAGHEFITLFGPHNTIKELPPANECSKMSPPGGGRAWQYYPEGWCTIAEFKQRIQELLT